MPSDVGVRFMEDIEKGESSNGRYGMVFDCIFGFSFRGTPRPPFDAILSTMNSLQKDDDATIVSVDVPSGWNVDEGPPSLAEGDGEGDAGGMVVLRPDVLVSLTAPKLCSRGFEGTHFVGGQFLPPHVAEKYGIRVS